MQLRVSGARKSEKSLRHYRPVRGPDLIPAHPEFGATVPLRPLAVTLVTLDTLGTMAYDSPSTTVFTWFRDAKERGFLQENRTARAPFRVLYQDFENWCRRTRRHPLTERSFGSVLSLGDFPSVRGTNGERMRGGIRVS